MYRRTLAVRWPFAVAICVTLASVAVISLWRSGGGTESAMQAIAAPTGTPAGEAHDGAALASESSPTPTLLEILQAADALAKAGKLPEAAPTPTLLEVLQAADVLAKAGELPEAAPTPTLQEVLQAADALAKAGKLPEAAPTPTLLETLRAADALAKAGKLPGQPPLAAADPTATSVPPQPSPTELPAAAGGWSDANYEARVLELANMQRAKFGLAAFAIDGRLERSAADYAQVLGALNWFSHTGPDGSTLVSRVEAAGFPFTVQIGEVLAWGNEGWTPEAMVQAWMNSPTHRQEILSPVYIRAGVGCYLTPANGTTVHCVIDFAG
jgi:uncharacterized protein YkwD